MCGRAADKGRLAWPRSPSLLSFSFASPFGLPSPGPLLGLAGTSAVDLLLEMPPFGVLSLPSSFGNVIFKCLAIHRNGSPFLEMSFNLDQYHFPPLLKGIL